MFVKKSVKAGLAAAGLAVALFGTQAWSYVRTGFNQVQGAIQSEVPISFELDRARNEVQLLLPEIRKSLHVVAEEQV